MHMGGGTGLFTTVSFPEPDLADCNLASAGCSWVPGLVTGLMVLCVSTDWRVERTRKPGSFSCGALFFWHIPLAAIQTISSNMCTAAVPIMEHSQSFDFTECKMVPLYGCWDEKKATVREFLQQNSQITGVRLDFTEVLAECLMLVMSRCDSHAANFQPPWLTNQLVRDFKKLL